MQNLYIWLTETVFVCFLCIHTTQCTYYTKFTQILHINRIIYVAADVWFLDIQKAYVLYFSNFCINNNSIFHSILQHTVKVSDQSFHIQNDTQIYSELI